MTFVNAAHYDNSASVTAVIVKPTGTVDNDIMFAFLKRIVTTDPTGVPPGWALLGKNSVGDTTHWLYWKLASSEGADYTWTWAGSARTGGTITAYRDGFNTASPIDVVSNTSYIVNDTICRAVSMAVSAANSPLFFFGAVHASSTVTFTKPSVPTTGWAEDVDTYSAGSRFARGICSMVWTSSGATGDMDATLSAASFDKHAFAVALNPSGGGLSIPVAMRHYRGLRI